MEQRPLPVEELIATNTTNAIIITDPDGRITWINQETMQLTGFSAGQLIGHKPGDLLQGPETDSQSVERMRTAIRSQAPFETTVANYTRSGMLYWVQISCRPFFAEDGTLRGFISTQVDVTRLKRLSDFNTLLAAVNQVIALCDDDLQLFAAICDLAVKHAHLELAWIGRPDETGRIMFLAQSGAGKAYLDNFTISVDPTIPEGQGPSGMTWRTGETHYSQSFSATPALKPWQERARSFGLDASATMPIFRNDEVWAVFSVYHARSGIFDRELTQVLDTLARDISHGLSRIDLRANERRLADQLYQEKELAQVTLASIEDAVVTIDLDGRVTLLNPKACELSGWDMDQALNRPLGDVICLRQDLADTHRPDPVQTALEKGKTIDIGNQTVLLARNQSRKHIEGSASPIFNQAAELQGCVLIFRDVTEKYEANQRLEWQANHDPLTGLPNRFALEKRLQSSIENARLRGTQVAVGLLDLDDFKPVNDRYGHEMGDKVLRELAQRLKANMREGDFLARLAGDELVVLIDDLDPNNETIALDGILMRLHEVVELPFDLTPENKVLLDMSMGVATYPQDGEDVDGLIRQADAAMYMAKANKYNRAQWWRHALLALPDRADEAPIDPYGPVARDLLGKTEADWQGLENEFVDAFYRRLRKLRSANRILELLSASELESLKSRQIQHLKRLISPELDWESHEAEAIQLGEIHAIIGVDSSDIMAAMDDYGQLLRYASQKLPWRVDARLALDSIMQSRLASEIQIQSRGRDRVEQGRVAHLSSLESQVQGWMEDGEFASRLAAHLSSMPCIVGVFVGRPNEQDTFVLEFSAGDLSRFQSGMLSEETADEDPAGSTTRPWRKAWLTGQIEVCDRFEQPQGLPDTAFDQTVRSATYLPILDAQGHSIILIALFGAYPGQFSQVPMRMWLESVQHMITPAFLRIERMGVKTPIDAATRQHYHELLFKNHLQIVVQPIVTLTTGQVEKVEVLARLHDGEKLLSPATFLPSFGRQDLQALFRKGLRQIMDWMVKWDELGLNLSVNLNLPPSVLTSPDCAQWVEEELSHHQLAPSRLYLELLETEDDAEDAWQRDKAISCLADMGVRLVMDDLGSGYSSLQRMRTLPFHGVKIDQELVRHAPSEPERTIPFIGSLVQVAQSIGLEVVVEGLETWDMVDMSLRLEAEFGQGYAICKPLLPEDLAEWIRQWRSSQPLTRLSTPLGELTASYKAQGPFKAKGRS